MADNEKWWEQKDWWGNKKNKIHPIDFNNEENKEWAKERQQLIDNCKNQRDKELAELKEQIDKLSRFET